MESDGVLKLGEALEVALAVKDLTASLVFYKTLGYSQFAQPQNTPHPWVVVTDGEINLGLHQYDKSSPALVYFSNEFEAVAAKVENLGIPFSARKNHAGQRIAIEFTDPNGQEIGVVDLQGGRIEIPKVTESVRIGEFGEFSIPTKDLKTSVAFYAHFGFTGKSYKTPYPWAILQDGLITIGLHQTGEFSLSTITYFDKNMPEIINWVRKKGFEPHFTNQNKAGITHEAGIFSPDGQQFYLFNWEEESAS